MAGWPTCDALCVGWPAQHKREWKGGDMGKDGEGSVVVETPKIQYADGRGPDDRVYVVNRSAHDYSAAEKWGKLVYVTEGLIDLFSANNHARLWAEALRNSTERDFIVLASLNIICSIGAALFATKHDGRLNILMFRRGKYIPKELHLNNLAQIGSIDDGNKDGVLRQHEGGSVEELST